MKKPIFKGLRRVRIALRRLVIEKKEDNGFKFRPVGAGMQDWEAILNACEEVDADIVIVEQDQSYEQSSLDAVKQSRQYLKEKFGI